MLLLKLSHCQYGGQVKTILKTIDLKPAMRSPCQRSRNKVSHDVNNGKVLNSAVNLTTIMLNSIASQIRIQTIFEVELQARRRRIQ